MLKHMSKKYPSPNLDAHLKEFGEIIGPIEFRQTISELKAVNDGKGLKNAEECIPHIEAIIGGDGAYELKKSLVQALGDIGTPAAEKSLKKLIEGGKECFGASSRPDKRFLAEQACVNLVNIYGSQNHPMSKYILDKMEFVYDNLTFERRDMAVVRHDVWQFPDGFISHCPTLALETPKGKPKVLLGYDPNYLTIKFIQGVKGDDMSGDNTTDGYNKAEFLLRHYLRTAKDVLIKDGKMLVPIAYEKGSDMTYGMKKLRGLYFRDDGILSLDKIRTKDVLGLDD